jgi:glyoxylase-like metal-dependent hydrolase (beta-lactamase superfamily II)
MLHLKVFTFNPFQENTYVIYNDEKECAIIDPGCYGASEEQELKKFITDNGLQPIMLLNTHAHVDHVFGNYFVCNEYRLLPVMHENELGILHSLLTVAELYGFKATESPEPVKFLKEGDIINLGSTKIKVLFTPGQSPGSVSFYVEEEKLLIAGDVLFQSSIGRTDLPGGDYDTLISSIKQQLFPLPDDTKVFPGHGPATTIGWEKKHNPFLT